MDWLVALTIIGIGILIYCMIVAPYGYEDENGFRLRDPKE